MAAPSRGARRDLSQAGLRRVKRASGTASYRPSGSAAQTAFSYPVRGERTARVVCRGDGGWGRAERSPSAGGWLLGCGQRAATGQVRQRTPNRRVEERQAGAEAEAAVPQKNRQSSARKALFRPPAEVQKASAVLPARGASNVFPSVRKMFPPFPAGERDGTSRPHKPSGRRVRRFFV